MMSSCLSVNRSGTAVGGQNTSRAHERPPGFPLSTGGNSSGGFCCPASQRKEASLSLPSPDCSRATVAKRLIALMQEYIILKLTSWLQKRHTLLVFNSCEPPGGPGVWAVAAAQTEPPLSPAAPPAARTRSLLSALRKPRGLVSLCFLSGKAESSLTLHTMSPLGT